MIKNQQMSQRLTSVPESTPPTARFKATLRRLLGANWVTETLMFALTLGTSLNKQTVKFVLASRGAKNETFSLFLRSAPFAATRG